MSQLSVSLVPGLPLSDNISGALLLSANPSANPSANFSPSVLHVGGDARLNEATDLSLIRAAVTCSQPSFGWFNASPDLAAEMAGGV